MARGWPDNWDPRRALTRPYAKRVSTPKDTAEASPQSTTWTLEKGILHAGVIVFPFGPAGLLHVQVFDGSTQIWPYGSGDYAEDGDRVVADPWNYPLITSPFQLTVKTWNTSTKYAHAVDIYIDVSKYD